MPVYPSNINSAQKEDWGHYCTCLLLPFLVCALAGIDQLIWSMKQVYPCLILVLQLANHGENRAASFETKLAKWTERPRKQFILTGPCCSIY